MFFSHFYWPQHRCHLIVYNNAQKINILKVPTSANWIFTQVVPLTMFKRYANLQLPLFAPFLINGVRPCSVNFEKKTNIEYKTQSKLYPRSTTLIINQFKLLYSLAYIGRGAYVGSPCSPTPSSGSKNRAKWRKNDVNFKKKHKIKRI